jgi:hypothetical protein
MARTHACDPPGPRTGPRRADHRAPKGKQFACFSGGALAEVSEAPAGRLLPSCGNDAAFVGAPDPATIAVACDTRGVSEAGQLYLL